MPKSLQATRDDAFGSAIAEDVISPACLSSPVRQPGKAFFRFFSQEVWQGF